MEPLRVRLNALGLISVVVLTPIGLPLSAPLKIPQDRRRLVADELSPGSSDLGVFGAAGKSETNPSQRLGMIDTRVQIGHLKAGTAVPRFSGHHSLELIDSLAQGLQCLQELF